MPDEAREDDPGWLLANLVDTVPHAQSAVLLSADGVPTASHGLPPDLADQASAIACGMFSLAHTAAVRFGCDSVRQVVAELDDFLLFISSAGFGSVITVLADREVNAGVLGYEMTQLVKSVRPFLATPPRSRGRSDPAAEAALPQRLPPAGPS